jgi:hypothetical protein
MSDLAWEIRSAADKHPLAHRRRPRSGPQLRGLLIRLVASLRQRPVQVHVPAIHYDVLAGGMPRLCG